jgi:putative ABC transport system permease protein
MFRYIAQTAKMSALFITSTLLLSMLLSAVPASIGSIQSTQLKTAESISNLSRGSYDILVRPVTARTEIEKKDGLVEENYLTGGMGGITLDQYRKILDLPNIEVAAPVAVVGFFTNNTGGIILTLPKPSDKPTLTTVELSNHTDLGREYIDSDITYAIQIPEESGVYSSKGLSYRQLDDGRYQVALELPTIYNLIVGVDPEQESKLLRETTSPLKYLPTGMTYSKITGSDGKIPKVPILVNEDLSSTIQVTVRTQNI